MKKIEGGVTRAKGFFASGIYAGIKKSRKDLAVVYTKDKAVGAGVFTSNIVKAAPVLWDMDIAKNSENIQAIVLNSGVANACTGEEGVKNNRIMAEVMADTFGFSANEVFTASTGVIGKQLPIEIIKKGIKNIKKTVSDTLDAGNLAANAIMTTDTYSKESAVSFIIDGKEVIIGGMAKGSGMIHPNMATMLGLITTDINISKDLLVDAIREDVKDSFNMISVDGDTSTNDSLFIIANGQAENVKIDKKDENYSLFCKALKEVTTDLAKQIAADGEGATKLLETRVYGAKTKEDAVTISKSIITSNLVKTAIYGSDANWGRILCAMGYSGSDFDPNKIEINIESENDSLQIVKAGTATDYLEEFASEILSKSHVKIIVNLHDGDCKATAWGCDLTYDYIKINADYRS